MPFTIKRWRLGPGIRLGSGGLKNSKGRIERLVCIYINGPQYLLFLGAWRSRAVLVCYLSEFGRCERVGVILKNKNSIESRVSFVVGYFGVPIIYLLASSGLSVEEAVRVLEIQSSLWILRPGCTDGTDDLYCPNIASGTEYGGRSHCDQLSPRPQQ